ncbi:MAG: PEP-CTERM sorting domain-containing protein [Phycisphaerae bacterium]
MKTSYLSIFALVLTLAVGVASADSVLQTSNMVLGEAGYIRNPSGSVTYGETGITLTSIVIDNPSSQIALPSTVDAVADSFFDVFTELTFVGLPGTSGPSTFTMLHSPSGVHYRNTYNGYPVGTPIMQYGTEMLSLDISGGSFMLRESPTLASTGGTTIGGVGGGLYAIDSFFDIFTELSTNGGVTWIPSSGGIWVDTITPEPTSLILMAMGGIAMVRRRRA